MSHTLTQNSASSVSVLMPSILGILLQARSSVFNFVCNR